MNVEWCNFSATSLQILSPAGEVDERHKDGDGLRLRRRKVVDVIWRWNVCLAYPRPWVWSPRATVNNINKKEQDIVLFTEWRKGFHQGLLTQRKRSSCPQGCLTCGTDPIEGMECHVWEYLSIHTTFGYSRVKVRHRQIVADAWVHIYHLNQKTSGGFW